MDYLARDRGEITIEDGYVPEKPIPALALTDARKGEPAGAGLTPQSKGDPAGAERES